MMDNASLVFANGICVAAHAPLFDSAALNTFFSNVIRHYQGKTRAVIAAHAREFEAAIKEWPAPPDMECGWELVKPRVRFALDKFAADAEAQS